MRIFRVLLAATLALATTLPVAAQDKPYKDGTVWSISFVKVKPGMFDVYMRDLASARKKLMEEAKKQGLIVSEKMLSGPSMGHDDFNLMLMVEYKNWAAFDGLNDKFDALSQKVVGSEEKRLQMMVKRTEVREIVGGKTMQEISYR